MPSLHELQVQVMRAVLHGTPEGAVPFIGARGIAPARTLQVYANTALANFTSSLVASFPAIVRLVGEDYFRTVVRSFHARHPSRSGDLQAAGTHFAAYLSQLHGAGAYRYLGEVARLEWLIQETLLAAQHAPFDFAKLQQVPPAEYDDLRFSLHPSARLFGSDFPCVRIWHANVSSDAEPEVIDLCAGCDRALLIRERGQLTLHRLSDGEHVFLSALLDGERFATAVQCGARQDAGDAQPDFDAAAALRRFVGAGAIVGFQ